MGIKTSGARLLCFLKRTTSVDFQKTCMLGRQELCMNSRQIYRMYKKYKDVLNGNDIFDPYCEKLISTLGGKIIDSLDVSDFEAATVIHDLNTKIPEGLEGIYTCIIDGGTTEHVFNYPLAMSNAIKMLEVGGYYIGMVPMNNWSGHGLYQFSPILFQQLFCKKNNMELIKLYVVKGYSTRTLFELKQWDPKNRIELNGLAPYEIYVVARKIGETSNEIILYQGDYEKRWEGKEIKSWKDNIRKLPWELQCLLRHFYKICSRQGKLLKIKI